MIRYIWNKYDGKYLWPDSTFKGEKIIVPISSHIIYVNIIESIYKNGITAYKVKLYYANGETLEGWTSDLNFPIQIINQDELFDGRFNQ